MPPRTRNGGRNGADPAGAAGDDDDDDAPVTRGELNDLVNAAVSGQLGRKLKPLQDQIQGIPTMITEGITAAVTAIGGQAGQQRQQAPGGQQGQNGQQGQQNGGQSADPAVAELRQQLDQVNAKLKQQTDAAAAADRRARETERDNGITTALSALGVDKHRMRGAVAVVRESLVEIKDPAAPGGVRYAYKAKRNGFEEDVDIAEGVAEWGRTDEGKSYLAPTQAARGGAGTRQTGGQAAGQAAGGGRGTPQDPKEAKAQKQQQALDQLARDLGASVQGGTVELGDA